MTDYLSILIAAALSVIMEDFLRSYSIIISEFLFMGAKFDTLLKSLESRTAFISGISSSSVLTRTANSKKRRVTTPTPQKIFMPYDSMKYL